ncbi:hypothetical protein C0992_004503 [Termitomyces sp. T32_za158]|nr:hypothetical protein C0992_004503 [Termitomyces sp. T32_za158]
MAVVSFARPGDAMLAKQKYDGKVVDGRRPLKIEIITEGTQGSGATGPPPTPSLLNRIGNPARTHSTAANGVSSMFVSRKSSFDMAQRSHCRPPQAQKTRSHMQVIPRPNAAIPIPPRRLRQKKGPKRIKKRAAVTVDQLDKEMEDYRAAADMSGLTGI